MAAHAVRMVNINNGVFLSPERLAYINEHLPKIPGHPDYCIDLCGNVYRVTPGLPGKGGCIPPHRLRSNVDVNGYRRVHIGYPIGPLDYLNRPCYPRRHALRLVHQLVARTYLGPLPKSKPWVCHMDGTTTENHPANLYYGTGYDNKKDSAWHAQVGKGTPDSIRPALRKLRAARIEKFGDPSVIAAQLTEQLFALEDRFAG